MANYGPGSFQKLYNAINAAKEKCYLVKVELDASDICTKASYTGTIRMASFTQEPETTVSVWFDEPFTLAITEKDALIEEQTDNEADEHFRIQYPNRSSVIEIDVFTGKH